MRAESRFLIAVVAATLLSGCALLGEKPAPPPEVKPAPVQFGMGYIGIGRVALHSGAAPLSGAGA